MATREHARSPAMPRRPAKDVIDAVLQNMQENLERLKYSTLAPSRYVVYLHKKEYARLEGIIPILQDEAIRALTEALDTLNRPRAFQRYRDLMGGERIPPVQNADAAWHVEFMVDPDDTLKEGDILVDSELLLPARPELGVGERTRRITTVHNGSRHTTREHTANAPVAPTTNRVFARLEYDDDSGHHSFDVARDSVTIGRGGSAYPVDVRIASSPDVSREHARLRRDPQTGQFYLIDLSSLGTTLNGRHVPPGFDDVDGTKRENRVETMLPDRARIGLADTVFLEFLRER